jgi:PDDEXK-like domain of unknown function (DUF3799)
VTDTTALRGVLDITEEDYFAATSMLSASGIKLLLPPSCPAKYQWAQTHPVRKGEFDIGSAAHKLVLGSGPGIEVIEADDWRKKATQEQRDAARAAGRIPILARNYERVTAMAAALREHPVAGPLFDPEHGLPERSLFWADAEHGIGCRARLDWLPDPRGGRLIIPDYKTCDDASAEAAARAAGNWAYHIQHAWYTRAAVACGLDDDPAFVFVFQEKEPPYLIHVVQLDAGAIMAGRVACDAGTEIFRDCMAAGAWPGYPDEVTEISLPPWKARIPEGAYS